MTPVWALILIGLGSGVVGTYLSTVLRISHERASELRSRMLEAADDFVRAVDGSERQLRDAASAQIAWSFFAQSNTDLARQHEEKASTTREAAWVAVTNVTSLVSRVRLLFGPDAAATRYAVQASDEVSRGMSAVFSFLTHYPGEDESPDEPAGDDELEIDRHYTEDERNRLNSEVRDQGRAARTALDLFSREARRDISDSRFGRLARPALP